MLIIVEGSNKVGKSSIIGKLKKLHNVSVIYNRDILKEMVNPQQESLISALSMLDVIKVVSATQNIILDRFHLSEYIYGEIVRGYENTAMFEKVDVELSKMDCLLVTVTSNYFHLDLEPNKLKEYESIQEFFKIAHNASKIKDKLLIKLEDIT